MFAAGSEKSYIFNRLAISAARLNRADI